MVGLLVFALFTIVALAAVGIAIATYYVLRHQTQAARPRHRTRSNSEFQTRTYSASDKEELQALQARLLSLVNGDRATAQRLIDYARASGNNKSENWYWEKAIEDLMRDRR